MEFDPDLSDSDRRTFPNTHGHSIEYTDANANQYSNGNKLANTNTIANSDTHGHAYGHAHKHAHKHPDVDAATIPHTDQHNGADIHAPASHAYSHTQLSSARFAGANRRSAGRRYAALHMAVERPTARGEPGL